MNDTFLTMFGNAVEDPVRRTTQHGDAMVTFRFASTPRRPNRDGDGFVDADTNFIDVVAYRGLARNVSASVRKGQPLVVHGRLQVRQWKTEERSGISVEIVATSVGHDLRRGTADYRKRSDGAWADDGPAPAPASGSQPIDDPWEVPGVGPASSYDPPDFAATPDVEHDAGQEAEATERLAS